MSEECEGVKKLTTLGSSRKKPCRHSWLIDHTIYQHPTSKAAYTSHYSPGTIYLATDKMRAALEAARRVRIKAAKQSAGRVIE